MKFLAAMSVAAASLASAHVVQQVHIPYDCYSQSEEIYGKQDGNIISDMNVMTGLDALNHRLTAVTACKDLNTKLISGITTVWSVFDNAGNQSQTVRLNLIGKLSEYYHWNDSAPIASLGVSSIVSANPATFQAYWFQESGPEKEQFYRQRAYDNSVTGDASWTNTRQAHFTDADFSGNGALNQDEAREFLQRVRPIDGSTLTVDQRLEKMDRQFFAARLFNTANPTEMRFQDYITLERVMEAWYVAGKMQALGNVNENTTDTTGQFLSHHCDTLTLDQDDRITYMLIEAGDYGIDKIAFQTSKQPEKELVATTASGYSAGYSFKNQNWIKFDNGIDFAGLYGSVNSNGDLAGLGYVQRDSTCAQGFVDALANSGRAYTWVSPKVVLTPPTLPADIVQTIQQRQATVDQAFVDYVQDVVAPSDATAIADQILDLQYVKDQYDSQVATLQATASSLTNQILQATATAQAAADASATVETNISTQIVQNYLVNRNIEEITVLTSRLNITSPTHDHEDKVETGLVVVTVFVWVAVAILMGLFVLMYCMQNKKGFSSHRE